MFSIIKIFAIANIWFEKATFLLKLKEICKKTTVKRNNTMGNIVPVTTITEHEPKTEEKFYALCYKTYNSNVQFNVGRANLNKFFHMSFSTQPQIEDILSAVVWL